MGLLSALIPGGDIAAAALQVGGSIFNSERGYHENRRNLDKSFEYSSALAAQQHEYEKEKMQNAYQWTMKDLQTSGLNPTLLMGGGGSATVAGGSGGGTIGAPSSGPANIDISSALKLSKELGLMDAQKEKIDSETELNNQTSGKTQQETMYLIENTKKVRADIENTLANSRLSEAQRKETMEKIDVLLKEEEKIGQEIKNLEKQGKILDVQKDFAKAEAIQRQITGYVDSAAGVVGAVKGTSALPMNIHSKGASAVYHQPGNLW